MNDDTEYVEVEGSVTYYVRGLVPAEALEDGAATAADIEKDLEHHPAGDEPLTPVKGRYTDTETENTQ